MRPCYALMFGFAATIGLALPVAAQTSQTTQSTTRPINTRALIPDAASQRKALQLLQQLYKPYPPTGINDKDKIAARLFDNAETDREAGARYIALREAAKLAQEAGNFRLSLRAVQAMAASFQVDGVELEIEVLQKTAPAVTQSDSAAFMNACGNVGWQAIGADRFDAAMRIFALQEQKAYSFKNDAFIEEAKKSAKDSRLLGDRFQAYATAVRKLKIDPKDKDSAVVAGEYLCFVKGDWTAGLGFLADGSDVNLAAAAQTDRSSPTDVGRVLKLADQWWDIAAKAPFPSDMIYLHAIHWYSAVLPSLTDNFQKESVKKRFVDWETQQLPAARNHRSPGLPAREDPEIDARIAHLRSRWEKPSNLPTKPLAVEAPVLSDLTLDGDTSSFSLAKEIQIGNSGPNRGGESVGARVHASSGFQLSGGTLVVSNGLLDLEGTPERPIVLSNVKIVCEYQGRVRAINAVFQECEFSKGGKFFWTNGYSSKWQFTNCLVDTSHFVSLDQLDYGVQFKGCVFIGCRMPPRSGDYNNKAKADGDGAKLAKAVWSNIDGCEFYECDLGTSAFWITKDCSFFGCNVKAPASFASKTDLILQLGVPLSDLQIFTDLSQKTGSLGAGQVFYLPGEPQRLNLPE